MDIHLDPDHKAFMLFEVPNAKTIRDVINEADFIYFLNAELQKTAEKYPTMYP